jgi:hypothetical protein
MAGLDTLMSGLNPASMILQGIGGVANIFGAIGQRDEARNQLEAQKMFGNTQRAALKEGYADLISRAKGLPTYQADITKYVQAQQEAEKQKMMAGGGGRVAGQAIAEEQARQTTANTLAAAQKGAQSGSDLLTAALMGQQQEGAQMQNIQAQSMQQRQQMEQQAQQNYLQSLGQTAAAQAQQAGMQFQSESQRANQVLGLGQEQLGQSMNLEQNLFQSEQAKAAAVAQANAAIWSGVGGLASGIGGGLMQMQSQANQMDMLSKLYPAAKTTTQSIDTLRSAQGDYEQMLNSRAFFGAPTTKLPAYSGSGVSILAPQAQTNFSGLLNPLAPR